MVIYRLLSFFIFFSDDNYSYLFFRKEEELKVTTQFKIETLPISWAVSQQSSRSEMAWSEGLVTPLRARTTRMIHEMDHGRGCIRDEWFVHYMSGKIGRKAFLVFQFQSFSGQKKSNKKPRLDCFSFKSLKQRESPCLSLEQRAMKSDRQEHRGLLG